MASFAGGSFFFLSDLVVFSNVQIENSQAPNGGGIYFY